MKTALITGIGGQDASYLAEHLLALGYRVHGLHRRSSVDNLRRVRHLLGSLTLHCGDVADGGSVSKAVHDCSPDCVFHCADQDHVGSSYDSPETSLQVTAGGMLRVLEAVRQYLTYKLLRRPVKVFIPISATVFGDAPAPQTEESPVAPQSPYAICKLAAWQFAKLYRSKYGMFVSCAVLYNHDSPRRGPGYLLGDLVRAALRVKHGLATTIPVGDPNAYVDIGFAGDYMEAAVRMLQLDAPDDFIISSGEVWKVADIVDEVQTAVGIAAPVVTTGSNPNKNGSRLFGDHRKATKAFGFAPKVGVRGLVAEVVKELSKEFK